MGFVQKLKNLDITYLSSEFFVCLTLSQIIEEEIIDFITTIIIIIFIFIIKIIFIPSDKLRAPAGEG